MCSWSCKSWIVLFELSKFTFRYLIVKIYCIFPPIVYDPGIHLQFLNFSTEAVHDYLEVRSGTLHSGSVIDRFSGPVVPESFFSTTHETSFFFHSDYSQNKPGFHITYEGKTDYTCPRSLLPLSIRTHTIGSLLTITG